MKKLLISILTILILFLLQTCIFTNLSFNGIVPNLMLMVVCIYGVIRGETDGIIAGFFCGLILDLLYSSVLGYNALLFMYAGYINGLMNKLYFEFEHKIAIFCVALTDILIGVVNYVILGLLKGRFNIGYFFSNIIFPEVVYTVLLYIAVYPLIVYIEHRFIDSEKTKEEENVL